MRYSEQTYREALACLAKLRETLTEEERPTLDFVAEAIAVKADRDCRPVPFGLINEQFTQADLARMHFERVWIDYGMDENGERCGEDGVVLYGRLYSLEALEGAGFEELLQDAMGGETLDRPTGQYKVFKRPLESNL